MKNAVGGLAVKACSILSAFVTRTIFLYILGIEYAGISTVFTDVLTVLSFAELGIGTAITYALYKPIAQNDEEQICRLMGVYQKIYTAIAATIFLLGLCFIPFLECVIKDAPDISEDVRLIYFLFLINTTVSYLLVYKSTFLTAAQKDYVVSKLRLIFTLVRTTVECLMLVITRNYVAYLVLSIGLSIIQNYTIAKAAEREYPVLKIKSSGKLRPDEKRKLIQDTKALALYKVSGTILNGTDSILTASILGTVSAGMLGNYNLITSQVYNFIMKLFDATAASVGNLAATTDREHQYAVFRQMLFIGFWIYCFCSTCLWTLLNPFVHVWQGGKYLLGDYVVALMVIEFYIKGLLSPVTQFRTSNGLFVQGRYRPLIMSIINIFVSIVLAHRLGIAGIILGTVISRAVTQLWYDPWLIYKKVFNKSVNDYFRIYSQYLLVTVACCLITSQLLNLLCPQEGVMKILVGLALCILIPNTTIVFLYHNNELFRRIGSLIKKMLHA